MEQPILINKSQLKKKIGCIKGFEQPGEYYKNTVKGYICGLPIWISTDLSQGEWDRLQIGS